MFSKHAPRPSATVVAADTFGSGVIKSDTDHRVYRDYGWANQILLATSEDDMSFRSREFIMRWVRRGEQVPGQAHHARHVIG